MPTSSTHAPQSPSPRVRRLGKVLIGLALAQAIGGPAAQASPESLRGRLAAHGYTDLAVVESADRVTVTFTDQTHRYLPIALGEVLAIASHDLPAARMVHLVPLFERSPIGSVDVDLERYRAWSRGGLTDAEFARSLAVRRGPEALPTRSDSSAWHSDLGLVPGYSLSGGLSLAIQEDWHVGLADRLGLEVAPQQTLTGPALPAVPLAALQQVGWLLPNLSSSARLGYFGADGWGGQIELGMPVGPVEFQLLGGAATQASPEGVAQLYVRPGWWNLGLHAGIGTYLDGDWGYQVGVTRTFERSSLTGALYRTSHGTDLRAVYRVALGGPARSKPGWLRLEPGVWNLVYQAGRPDLGRTLLPVSDLDLFYENLYADEVVQAVSSWPKAKDPGAD
jgi:hypothetical protein